MTGLIINTIIYVTGLYLVIGLVFSIAFINKGAETIDETAAGSGPGFKLIIIPGCMVFWPLLLSKWINSKRKKQ